MTPWLLAAAAFALAPESSHAERPARFENAILYSHLRSDTASAGSSLHSYHLGYTLFLNRRLGLGGNLIQASEHNVDFLFGPEIGLLDNGRLGVRVHARAGSIRRSYAHSTRLGVTQTGWHFASTLGTSVDAYLGKGVTWRVVQPELIWWKQKQGSAQTDLRVSTGVVLRFGKTQ